MAARPDIVLILADDMGFSDIGCYGGEVLTPNLDRLSANGLRFTQFYSTARCCPSRASLLTGLYPHQAGVGHMLEDDGIDGYLGDLSNHSATIAEALKPAGYRCYMSGKWHVARNVRSDGSRHNWPCNRGFDRYHGLLTGAASYFHPLTFCSDNEPIEIDNSSQDYYLTDDISDHAVGFINEHHARCDESPFFMYVPYTAPHWPLHAMPDDIRKYEQRFAAGWDQLREERMQRMCKQGIIKPHWQLSPRDPTQPPWNEEAFKDWNLRRMAVYAAQIDRMDQGIGRIVRTLERTGRIENTLIMFLSDNGGCAEVLRHDSLSSLKGRAAVETARDGRPVLFGNCPEVVPGGEETYSSYGVAWANLSNTPFREYKHWVHEGGIATPFVVHWPAGMKRRGELNHTPAQLPDIMATCLDAADAEYPAIVRGHRTLPLEGFSMASLFKDGGFARPALFWEHEGNRAVRKGNMKLVCKFPGKWELYDMEKDRTELDDLAAQMPDVVRELDNLYTEWARRCSVLPWEKVMELRRSRAK